MKKINWKYCQSNSDLILASGAQLLDKDSTSTFEDLYPRKYGNYLISDKANKWKYIGEAKTLSNRIKQHSKEKTSTFYKNYLNLQNNFPDLPKGLKISDFQIQTILTNIGRKEIEEFGIVNIPANLNTFQNSKRQKYAEETDQKVWNEVQSRFSLLLEQGEKELLESKDYSWFDAQVQSTAGIYWVEHSAKGLIYIGESSNMLDRFDTHSSTTYFSALRRHIGENILGFHLQTRNGKKKHFEDKEEIRVTDLLKKCTIKPCIVNFGRYELEEYLIRKHKPLLNRKEKK
ncbi:MAG: putative GIY-YIG superfamily endonuclease [Cyclobacteriaceae bacterium]|jgi:predicted GIY-YIG superfamily endonuclease